MKWKVLITAPYMLPFPEEFRKRLENEEIEILTTQVKECLNEEELIPLVKHIDGVVCGDDQFTARVFQSAPNLKVVSKWGTGTNSIDIRAAQSLGIKIFNTPNAFTDAVADTVIGYVLCFARNLPLMDRNVRSGMWIKPQSISLRECTLGIVGIGNIGKAVARRARSFGMKVIGNDITPIPETVMVELQITMMPLQKLLENSDYVTLNCDLNPTSFYLMGRNEFRAMRSTAYLINTSRGSVIDETALIEALQKEQIAGAALDVFEIEPLPAGNPLRSLNNCMLAPHNSNSSPAARQRVHESTILNLIKGLKMEL